MVASYFNYEFVLQMEKLALSSKLSALSYELDFKVTLKGVPVNMSGFAFGICLSLLDIST